MNRWQEKNKDKNFKNNSNASIAFKNTHKQKSQGLIVINSTLIFLRKSEGWGINSGIGRTEMRG